MKNGFGKLGVSLVLATCLILISISGFAVKVFASSTGNESPFTMPYGGKLELQGFYSLTPHYFHDGVAIFSVGSGFSTRYGLCDSSGKIIIPAKYSSIIGFADGLAVVGGYVEDGSNERLIEGIIDTKGNIKPVEPIMYEGEIYVAEFASGTFDNGLIELRYKSREKGRKLIPSVWVDRTGKPVTTGAWDYINNLDTSMPFATPKEDYGYICDANGKELFPVGSTGSGRSGVRQNFHQEYGFAIFMENDEQDYVFRDRSGQELYSILADAKQGKITIPADYLEVLPFSEGLAYVSNGASAGFISKSGNLVVPMEYSFAQDIATGYSHTKNSLHDGLALMRKKSGEYATITSPQVSEKRQVIANAQGDQDAVAKLLVKDGIFQDEYDFGSRSDPPLRTETEAGHTGVDIFNKLGQEANTYDADAIIKYPLLTSGKVVTPKNGFGNCVTIETRINGDTYTLVFGHMQDINVKIGQIVDFGTNLGTVGKSGGGSGQMHHLHFEIRKGSWAAGNLINPTEFVLEN